MPAPVSTPHFQQQDQPEGVPPLELTGERTLPNVPEENYWYRRHVAVYEWIAAQVGGARVIDMACGEGYGSDLLARTAAGVVGVDANPEAHEHARLRYRRANLRFARDLVETFSEPADAVVFLQTIEHLQDPGAVLEHFASLLRAGRGTKESARAMRWRRTALVKERRRTGQAGPARAAQAPSTSQPRTSSR